jgi:hypothetical protein
LLATLVVMYLPLLRLRKSDGRSAFSWAAAAACIAAVWVHPTNIFIAAFLIVPPLYLRRQSLGRILRRARIPAKPWVFAALATLLAGLPVLTWRWAPQVLERLHGPGEIGPFLADYVRLFSGTTIYQFISGAGLETSQSAGYEYTTMACNVGFGLLAILAAWGLVRRIEVAVDPVDACLLLAWFAMLALLFVVAGPQAIAPHFERYDICLVAPGALVLARGLVYWIDLPRRRAGGIAVPLALAAWLWPASFYVNYFQCLIERGGYSHYTFRTAEIEPKVAAIETIRRMRPADAPAIVVCHQWWNYWPMAYLAFDDPLLRVLTWDEWRALVAGGNPHRSDDTWFVEFSGTLDELDARRAARAMSPDVRRFTIVDFGRRPLISLVHAPAKFSKNY